MKDLFIEVLKKRNALIPFIINIQNEKCRFYDNWDKITLSQALSSKKEHQWTTLFRWKDTLEGYDFWRDIHYTWFSVKKQLADRRFESYPYL